MARTHSQTKPPDGIAETEVDTDSSRQYIHVQPTTDVLRPATVTDQFGRLHGVRVEREQRSFFDRLRNRTPVEAPIIECLLTTSGEPNATIGYHFGTTAEALDDVERILRTLFPDSYEFERAGFSLESIFRDGTFITQDVDAEGTDAPETNVEAMTFHGRGERSNDWQTRLTPYEQRCDERVPLSAVVEALADATVPMTFQVLLRSKSDWSVDADLRRERLKQGRDTHTQRIVADLFGSTHTTPEERGRQLGKAVRVRLDELDEKDARMSFEVCARAVACASDRDQAAAAVAGVKNAFSAVSRTCYRIESTRHRDKAGERVLTRVLDREFEPDSRGVRSLLGSKRVSRSIVADPTEVPNFCILSGDALTTAAERALAITPDERSVVPRPPEDLLTMYTSGLTLGCPRTEDGAAQSEPISLPPQLQPLHVAWFGKTGSGKSTSLVRGMLDNHGSTAGPSILIDPKGDGMPIEYLRAHYATHGDLESVYYFDCAELLPALSFFDIRPQLAAGVERSTAVQDAVDHYIEILMGVMGRERFERAVRSPDIIRYLVKALFDPVHGSDAFTHRELQRAATRMAETREAPPVTDDDLEVLLGGVVTNSPRSFDELMQGVLNRIEKIPLDDRLAQVFNHVPQTGEGDGLGTERIDPHFDFFDVLDEDAVVIIDSSQLRTDGRRALTLVLLSNLWTALHRRHAQGESDDDVSLVNLYLEEAAGVASSGLMTDLLSQSRGFGLSVTLAMQFPAQVRTADTAAYAEILNNVSTIITGNVAVDRDLEKRLATADMPPSEVGNRLRALRRGQWFVSLPAGFGESEPRPFVVTSAPLPAGHPDGENPLSETQELGFDALVDAIRDRTRLDHGLDLREQDPEISSPSTEPESTASMSTRVDSALPYTKRLPACLRYDGEIHALVCTGCESRYSPSLAGMRRAIDCCTSLDRVDRDAIPICDVGLRLSEREREESDYSDRQLAFLQVVYAAHQGEYDSKLEYDPLWDSMLRLQEYVGIESEEVQELVDDGLLSIDCDYPHRLYTATAAGRSELQTPHREGVAYGHGVGDLGESTLHRVMVDLGRELLEESFVNDPESDVVDTIPYYELEDGHRLDAVGLAADGEVLVTLEAERLNHDVLRAVPDDYDKMAAFTPEKAIWLVENREGAHDVLGALNDPPTGEKRVSKTYSRSTAPRVFTLDAPGCTDIHTFRYVRDSLLELAPPESK